MSMPTPNTNEPLENGQTPGSLIYQYCKKRHVCIRCRVRWVEANILLCVVCESSVAAYHAKKIRRKSNKKDKNPSMVEIVIARDLSGVGLLLSLQSDIGTLLSVHKITTVDIRDARKGKAKISSYREAA